MAISQKILDKLKKKKAVWAEARKAKPGEYSVPKIKDGEYKLRFTAKCGVDKNDKLYVRLLWTIVKGSQQGKGHNLYYNLDNENEEQQLGAWKGLAANVQALMGVDTSGEDYKNNPAALFELLDQLNEEKPQAICRVSTKKSEKGNDYINVYINERVDDEDSEGGEEEEDEEAEDAEDEDEEDEEAEDEESGEDGEEENESEEELVPPEKDDVVKYKPPRARKAIKCKVLTVNNRDATATLKELDGSERKFPGVPWDELEYVDG